MKRFIVCGIHPEISLAEVKAVLGDQKPVLVDSVAIVDPKKWDGSGLQKQLAGIVKLGDIIDERTIDVLDEKILADHIEARPRSKRVLFGLTIVGGSSKDRARFKNLPILLKRELQNRGKAVRWVTGEKGVLAPAAVSKLALTTDGYDFVIIIHGKNVSVGLTTDVQHIDDWSLRDYGRPFRDAKTGMLPPKLARMMVNLATPTQALLDPFCGSGTVIMEAALVAPEITLVGSDIDARQIAGAQKNMEWLIKKAWLSKNDAERINWIIAPVQAINTHLAGKQFDAIVTEGYLGAPLSGHESKSVLEKERAAIEKLWSESLPILASMQPPEGRLVAIWPDLVASHGSYSVNPIQAAEDAGYRLAQKPLIYARPDQHVRRKIVILVKK